MEVNPYDIIKARMTNAQFKQMSSFIFTQVGIKMPEVKKVMLESRLQKRLKALSMSNFNEYLDFLFSKEGQKNELVHMLDVVTTNKTDFFREPVHFDYIRQFIIPEFVKKDGYKPLSVWSAGCSSGEEPYTIAMVLESEQEKGNIPGYRILATDISTKVLGKAIEAIYPFDRISDIPHEMKKKYLLKHKDPVVSKVRIKPELRSKISFERLNLMDEVYCIPELFDMVFCRNVIIYFDRKTQESVITKLSSKLREGGYLFLGHSESITNLNVPLKSIYPTVFLKQ